MLPSRENRKGWCNMNVLAIPCSTVNYGGLRAHKVEYIVIHYTAGRGDTAQNNGNYFAKNSVGASAHWFVDENDAVLSVPEEFVAWHCGGAAYKHPACRNSNSIGVELCSEMDAEGTYYFTAETVENAQELVRQLMEKYNVPAERVIRHYDVTGKTCPAPFVGAGKDAWDEFKGGLTVYKKLENVPEWAKQTVQKVVDKGALKGDEQGNLNLTGDLTRTLVILDRLGKLD